MSSNIQDWNHLIIKKATTNKSKPHHTTNNTVSVKKIYDESNPDAEPDIRPVKVDGDFAEQMTKARNARGMTQKQLANALSIDVAIIADYERGTGIKDGKIVAKIKRYLNIHK